MKNFKEFIEEMGFTNDNFLNTGVVDLMVKLQIDYDKYVKLNLPGVSNHVCPNGKEGLIRETDFGKQCSNCMEFI